MQPWVVANPQGILVDNQQSAWHAGRVFDMLSLGAGRILVASATGGVWLIDGAFNGFPLSDDWEFPDTQCLAFGPRWRRPHLRRLPGWTLRNRSPRR